MDGRREQQPARGHPAGRLLLRGARACRICAILPVQGRAARSLQGGQRARMGSSMLRRYRRAPSSHEPAGGGGGIMSPIPIMRSIVRSILITRGIVRIIPIMCCILREGGVASCSH